MCHKPSYGHVLPHVLPPPVHPPSVCSPVKPSSHPSVRLPSFHLSTHLSTHPSTHPSIHLPSIHLHESRQPACLSRHGAGLYCKDEAIKRRGEQTQPPSPGLQTRGWSRDQASSPTGHLTWCKPTRCPAAIFLSGLQNVPPPADNMGFMSTQEKTVCMTSRDFAPEPNLKDLQSARCPSSLGSVQPRADVFLLSHGPLTLQERPHSRGRMDCT